MAYLLGDIGGTNLRLCLYQDEKIVRQQTYSTTQYPRIEEAMKAFLGDQTAEKCCLAIAGPVQSHGTHETVVLTNQQHQLEYSTRELQEALGFPVKFINDFAAIGYYLTRQRGPGDFRVLVEGRPAADGAGVYLGAGTGLGVGYLYGTRVFACEGGHARFGAESAFALEFADYYKAQVGSPAHLSWDRVVSGPGLGWLLRFVTQTRKTVGDVLAADCVLSNIMGTQYSAAEKNAAFAPVGGDDAAAAVSQRALAGDRQALALMGLFFAWYGAFAADVCVTFCPAVLYLTGGIVLKNMALLDRKDVRQVFLDSYCRKGRLAHIPQNTALKVILDGDCGLSGCIEAIKILL